MGAGLGRRPVRDSCGDGQRGQQQALRHGGAGPIEPQVGQPRIAHGKRRTDALVQQVSGEHQIQIKPLDFCLFQQQAQGLLLHGLLRLLPGLLTEKGILAGFVEAMAQRPLALLLPGHTGPGRDHRRLGQKEARPPPLVFCHSFHSFWE